MLLVGRSLNETGSLLQGLHLLLRTTGNGAVSQGQ